MSIVNLNSNTQTGNIDSEATLTGELSSSLVSGIDTINVNEIPQEISAHTANIEITYDMLYDKPNFVEDNDYVHTDNNYTDNEKSKLASLENYDDTEIKSSLNNKVDKVSGKSLSTNDYTDNEKTKLAGLSNYDDTEIKGDIADLETNKADKNEIPDVSNFITKDINNLTYYTLATNTGSTIELSINSSTYVVTLNLKNSAGTTISTGTIDLPLESMVVSGSYNDNTKKIILTLQSGDTIEFSVADLVSGLQSEITSNNKLSSDLVDDTNHTNKFVSASEKTTWNAKYDKPSGGIPNTDLSSAVQTSLGKADTALQSFTETDPVFSASAAADITSSDITNWNNKSDFSGSYNDLSNKPTIPSALSDLSDDSTHRVVTDTEKSTWSGKQNALVSGTNIKTINNQSILGSGNIEIQGGGATYTAGTNIQISNENVISATDTTYSNATTESSGLMSATDKTKLNGISSGAEVNVQADWNESDSSDDSYIKNKPTIPTVPTNVSAFTNDAGYTTNTGTITSVKMNGSTISSSGEADLGTVITQHQDISGKLDTSKVKTTTSTTSGDVYDVTYINSVLGDISTALSSLVTVGGGN